AFVGAAAGFGDLIGVDIGGTSADISLIKDGRPSVTVNGRVGEWPLSLPMVDIVTIGAGGGSIARVSRAGALTVGPQSAGADPGPCCYRRGGTEPTVTDAHLVLGHLPPWLLDGSFELDVEAAQRAVATRVAEPLGLDLMAAARGILAIADSHMVGAIRVVSVERGRDPRDFVLVPFGGAGPLHGGALARLLDIRTQLVAPSPGVLSALGLLVSNLKADFARTCLQQHGHYDLAQMASAFAGLQADAERWFERESVPEAARGTAWSASLRYEHQGFELTVDWPGTAVDEAAVRETVRRFHELHRATYTFAQEDTPVEIVTLRVDASGALPQPRLSELAPGWRPGRGHRVAPGHPSRERHRRCAGLCPLAARRRRAHRGPRHRRPARRHDPVAAPADRRGPSDRQPDRARGFIVLCCHPARGCPARSAARGLWSRSKGPSLRSG
ncbi:hydantoinase/oxoprolinase family protein, partial [Reyranella sp.]|uniref:hydantoinase/oxoprolinase family protein n=1 Tax=Reyranella sp. TaxID=1929291 RepID=UPI003BAB6DE0